MNAKREQTDSNQKSKIINHKSELSSLDWRNGIVVRSPNWLGDAIMALPAMTCLRSALPEKCRFFVVCPDNLFPLYSSIPWISKIITTGSGHSYLSKEKLRELSGLGAGVGFLFVNSLRPAWYFWRTVPKVYGASNGLRNILLTKNFKVRWHEKKSYSEEHQSYKYLSMVYKLGCQKWDEKYPDFTLIDSSELRSLELKTFLKEGQVLVVAPGAAYGPAKRWPSSYYNEVCRYWIREKKGRVIILGAENEFETAENVFSGLGPYALNLAGKTNLKELIYILKKSDICVSNDSGVMHLGSALNVKGVALFGSTDPFSTGPLSKNWTVLLMKKQSCAPCFSRECVNTKKDYKCLKAITPADVIEAIEKLISGRDKIM